MFKISEKRKGNAMAKSTKEILNECKKYKDTIMDTVIDILDDNNIKHENHEGGYGLFVEAKSDEVESLINNNSDIPITVIKVLLDVIASPNGEMSLVRVKYN